MSYKLLVALFLITGLALTNGCKKDEKPTEPRYTAPEPGEEREFELTESESITMVWIPAGSFIMGAQEDEQDQESGERPVHRVTFNNGFWMGKYELTQLQWVAVMGENPSWFPGAHRPVDYLSWDDIQWFEQRVNYEFRLPSESEWEYACRAGTTSRYYWGDDPDYAEIDDYAWHLDNAVRGTREIGMRQPNAWGLYDMSGNVREWCEDWWHEDYTGAPNNGSPWVASGGQSRVYRGGCWDFGAIWCRSANRDYSQPSFRGNGVGFRLVRDE